MRRIAAAAAAVAMLLSGCSTVSQIEGQAFAVALAVDVEEDARVTVSVQFPSYGAKEAGGDSAGKDDYLLSSATGESFSSALYALRASIPRALNLTQIKSMIVSERLASSSLFAALMREVRLSWRISGEACLVVVPGRVQDFLAVQHPLIGLRLSDTIVTALERFEQMGIIPHSTLSEVFYDIESIYGDPVAVLAAVAEGQGSAARPKDAVAGELMREGDNQDEYFGTALFANGAMAGRLTGGETQLLRLILGGRGQMPMEVGGAVIYVTRRGPLNVRVDCAGDVPRIDVALEVGVEDMREDPDEAAVLHALTEGLDRLTARCQQLGADPFDYARCAAAGFPTIAAWRAYDWRSRFPRAVVTYRLSLVRINA